MKFVRVLNGLLVPRNGISIMGLLELIFARAVAEAKKKPGNAVQLCRYVDMVTSRGSIAC